MTNDGNAEWNALRFEYSLTSIRNRQKKKQMALSLRHKQEMDALSLKQSREVSITLAEKALITKEYLHARQLLEMVTMVPNASRNCEPGMMQMRHLEEQQMLRRKLERKERLLAHTQTWEKEALSLRHSQQITEMELEQKCDIAAAVDAANIELAIEDVLAQHGFDFSANP
jgi:hypothetical protein